MCIRDRRREGVIEDVKISLGAVAPTVVRARRSEEILKGAKPDDENLRQAARAVIHDISPIDDVRGSAGYRAEMAVNYVYMALKRLVMGR